MFCEAPLGIAFVLDEFNVSYARFAELSAPLAVHFTVVEKYYRKRSLSGLQAHTEWHQAELRAGTMDVRWNFVQLAVLARLRRTDTTSGRHPCVMAAGWRVPLCLSSSVRGLT
ncbi:hypothetical protein KQH60_04285 [Mycetohabitans sp. B8]|nr:hypothetical protein [Mycetohabitans sp. B8]